MMRDRSKLAVNLLCLAVSLLAGCTSNISVAPSGNWGSSVSSVNTQSARYSTMRLEHDKIPYLILAVDGVGLGKAGGGGGRHEGRFAESSGTPSVEWSCVTDDATTGAVTISGRKYDLAKGGLFLVNAKREPVSIQQLAIPLAGLQAGTPPGRFADDATKHPQIAEFLKSASAIEPEAAEKPAPVE